MKTLTQFAAILLLVNTSATAQTIIADAYNTPTSTVKGFVLGEGVNAEINPPATRLTGTAASGLRYMNATPTQKPDSVYWIDGGKLRVNAGAQSGRATISADGTSAFDFASALGSLTATPLNPVQYDITISMDNNAAGTHRFSWALGTVESSAGDWDFGLQLYRAVSGQDFYTVGKRIDTLSSGLAGDLNEAMFTMDAGSVNTEVSFVIRVTDAGAETDTFSSRVMVSADGGNTWLYDTLNDPKLTESGSGFRFDGAGRFFSWDIAGGNSSFVTYDNFSVTIVPEPSALVYGFLGLAALVLRQRR